MSDYTLGHFLRGVVQFTARHPPPESSPEARRASEGEASEEEIDAGAEKDFLLVLEHAPKVEVRFPFASILTFVFLRSLHVEDKNIR
jgi:hypothetical protein